MTLGAICVSHGEVCGVAGILGKLDDGNRAALQRMMDALRHRGPDGAGAWESTPDEQGQGVMLGHRRLSILDLTDAATQPMVDPVTGHVIAFNGEVYNYQSLRERWVARGHAFTSTGDTAVVLRALAVDGRGALESFRGMFAFGLWDPKRRELLLARDPLGIKPLYFAVGRAGGQWSLAFASEVRALLASGLLGKPRLDPHAAASVVWNGFVVGPHTAVAGIESLGPGELRLFDDQGRERLATDHWSAARVASATATNEAEVGRALEESVRLHLVSDVPLGIFLSSGVDSSAVANLAQRASPGQVRTFTLSFEEQELDEGIWSRRIAAAIGTQHQEVTLTEQRFVAELEPALDSLDQPTFDGLNAYYLSRAIREAGVKVALVGTGGDELFGGYTTFRDLPFMRRFSRGTRALPRGLLVAAGRGVARLLNGAPSAFPPQTRWAKLPSMVARGDDLLGLYQLAYALFLPEMQRDLLDGASASVVDGLSDVLRERLSREIRGRSTLSAISVLEERMFLGERLLRDGDAASMAASIEQRLPLVDRVLFETADRLPDSARYRPLRQKALLRRVGLQGLEPALFNRPKSGFVLPFDRWIRRGLNDAIDATLRDATAVRAVGLDPNAVARLWAAFCAGAKGVYWSRVWALYVYVRWCQRHGLAL